MYNVYELRQFATSVQYFFFFLVVQYCFVLTNHITKGAVNFVRTSRSKIALWGSKGFEKFRTFDLFALQISMTFRTFDFFF